MKTSGGPRERNFKIDADYMSTPERLAICPYCGCVGSQQSPPRHESHPPTLANHRYYLEYTAPCGSRWTITIVGISTGSPHFCTVRFSCEDEYPGVVYFIRCFATGLVKIGWTSGRPLERLSQLQVGSASELMLIATEPAHPSRETELHEQFAYLRVRGEWFHSDPIMVDLIRRLQVAEGKKILRRKQGEINP